MVAVQGILTILEVTDTTAVLFEAEAKNAELDESVIFGSHPGLIISFPIGSGIISDT
jgi:hypothetical protein